MRITINGIAGSGKSTVAKYLAKRFKLKYYGMGEIRREMAKKRGITLSELDKLGEKKSFTDKLEDNFQKKLRKKDNIIVDGRLSWYFIPNSIKVFLKVKPEIGAKRIFKQKRKEERYKTIKEEMNSLKARLKSEDKRYKKYYGIKDIYNIKNYDIIIDTSDMIINQGNKAVEKAILKFLKN